ncbi:hypothetical protein PAPYR_8180 [Paratrimastix pyriformis]|uniref:Uncharacterized protein n=1 Tax=Paratrimastix pyriformis TaxID=342808 RepID=A0ABQ8UB60_9EUKA|nr:hypothetical protein PAPYR_8180 [Paratrimastix pyriformis]
MCHRAAGYGRGEVGADRGDKMQVSTVELEASEEGAEGPYSLFDGDGFAEAAARVRAVQEVLQLPDLLQRGAPARGQEVPPVALGLLCAPGE